MFNKGAIHSISCFPFLIQYCDIYCIVFNHIKEKNQVYTTYILPHVFFKIVFIWKRSDSV